MKKIFLILLFFLGLVGCSCKRNQKIQISPKEKDQQKTFTNFTLMGQDVGCQKQA